MQYDLILNVHIWSLTNEHIIYIHIRFLVPVLGCMWGRGMYICTEVREGEKACLCNTETHNFLRHERSRVTSGLFVWKGSERGLLCKASHEGEGGFHKLSPR